MSLACEMRIFSFSYSHISLMAMASFGMSKCVFIKICLFNAETLNQPTLCIKTRISISFPLSSL